jgi:hypothetical protein
MKPCIVRFTAGSAPAYRPPPHAMMTLDSEAMAAIEQVLQNRLSDASELPQLGIELKFTGSHTRKPLSRIPAALIFSSCLCGEPYFTARAAK